jgi:hypothetical protein
MTEASIGSGLTTMIFLYAIRKTQGNNNSNNDTANNGVAGKKR